VKKIILTIAVICLVGCVSTKKEVMKEMPGTQVASRGAEKLLPLEELTVTQVVEEVKEREKYFSLSVNNMELRNVFFILAKEISEYNVVVDPDVTGAVTVSFVDLPLEKVLEILLEPLGLEYITEDNILRISKPRVVTRTFDFVYSTTTRTSTSSLMAVTGSGGSGSNQVRGGGRTTGGGTGRGGGVSGGMNSSSFDSINTLEEVNVWEELESGIRELLSDEGMLSTNRRTGRITITDFRSNLKVLDNFIEYFKRETMRQIHIKAKIIEVTLNDESAFGINWDYLFSVGSAGVTLGQSFAPAVNALPDFANMVTGTVTSDSGDLDAVVRALEGQGNVKVLSSPQVTTLNGQTAVIRSITEDVVFQQSTNQTGNFIQISVTADPFVYGVFLGVTPHADSEGTITMDIHPSVSSLVKIAVFPSADMPAASRPIIDTRETQTVVAVEDQEVIVIAGLMQDDVRENISKFPVLGDIPYIGKAFRRELKESEKTELVILLTPTIVGHSAKDFGSIRDKFKLLEKDFKNL
jgi:MSHA biogenesis protein MshL